MNDSAFAHPRRNLEALGIASGMRVADFGAGSGAYAFAIAELLNGSGTVYAVDIQKDLLRRIKNESSHRSIEVEIIWGDLEHAGGSKLADVSLDLVLVSNLLFQVRDRAAVVVEAVRVVREGGRVAIIDWSESFGGMGPQTADVCGKDEVLGYARDAGLVFVDEFTAGAHHFGLIFRKGAHTPSRS